VEWCASKARLAAKCAADRDDRQLNWPSDELTGSYSESGDPS
jgi:hypothetical protein